MPAKNLGPKTIYAIHCRETRRTYIGCCSDFRSRVNQHFYQLRNGEKFTYIGKGGAGNRRRINTPWQEDYNSFGADAFDVYEIESNVDAGVAAEREHFYILKYRSNEPQYGYNIRPVPGAVQFTVKKGKPPLPAIAVDETA